MVVMSDFTTEQLKAIVGMGMNVIKEELKERFDVENKFKFPIEVGDYFFNESEQNVYRITNVTYDRINYELARVHNRSIISSYNSYVDRDFHDFDSMVKTDKKTFDLIQNIAKNYEIESNELKRSAVKSANDILSVYSKKKYIYLQNR